MLRPYRPMPRPSWPRNTGFRLSATACAWFAAVPLPIRSRSQVRFVASRFQLSLAAQVAFPWMVGCPDRRPASSSGACRSRPRPAFRGWRLPPKALRDGRVRRGDRKRGTRPGSAPGPPARWPQ